MALAITTLNPLPPVLVSTAYSQSLAATGGTPPYTWSLVTDSSGEPPNFPTWLTLNAATGMITGTALTSAQYNFTVQVQDSSVPPQVAVGNFSIPSGYTKVSDIANWVISDYLNRTDLTVVAQNAALYFYRILCAKVPFEELHTVSQELNMQTGVPTYDLSQLVPPLVGIVNIRVTLNPATVGSGVPGTRRRLRRSSARLYDSLSYSVTGPPSTYARTAGLQIQISPPPNQPYQFRVRYWTRPAEAPTPSNTVLVTPLEWDELLRWETAWRVLNMTGQEQRAAMLIAPEPYPRQRPAPKKLLMMGQGIIPRLWNELLSTHSQKENVDEDFNINPVIRPYSVASGR